MAKKDRSRKFAEESIFQIFFLTLLLLSNFPCDHRSLLILSSGLNFVFKARFLVVPGSNNSDSGMKTA